MTWIELDGADNVRDVGGLPTSRGTIRPGRLIRADNLQDLTDRDVAVLREVPVSDVVDLRSAVERSVEGDPPLMSYDVRHHHLSLLPEDGPEDGDGAAETAEEAILPWSPRARRERPVRSPEDEAAGPYFGYLLDKPAAVAGALEVIADAGGATIVHCAAGKDRTGTITALALAAAGVDRATIIEDYVLTGERIERVVARLGTRTSYAEAMAGVSLQQHQPRPAAMNAMLDAVDRRWGGTRGWLLANGWSEAGVDALVSSLRD